MYCFVDFLSLSEVHTKKVRKVPPGLPSSVSDDMPCFFSCVISMVSLVLQVCVADGKGPLTPLYVWNHRAGFVAEET